MKESYKDIACYHTAAILPFTDFLCVFPYLQYLQHKTTTGLKLDYLGDRKQIEKDIKHGAFFITNHRDIVMDAAWLSYLLRTRYFIRPYMGVGNNLFAAKWIEFLMKFNRCFAVKRGCGAHAQLENSKQLSAYIHHLRDRHKSIWLAQREGRAKDSNDLTQASVIHMLTLGEGDFWENVKALNFCPVSISYEYDPCDYLKAREMQLKRDDPRWRKSKRDDVESMKTGIEGFKGRVVYRLTPSINPEIDALLSSHPEIREASSHDQLQAVCDIIDRHIHQGYEIFERGTEFEAYIESRIALIDIPNKDEAFLREKLIEMYEFPVINHKKSLEFSDMKNEVNRAPEGAKKKAIFPGSFDPFTVGHYDIVKRGLEIFDEIIIGIGRNSTKKETFPIREREEAIRKIFADEPRVKVAIYDCLTVDFAKEQEAQFILRGMRCIGDFEYERNMAEANKQIGNIETIILYTRPEYAHISSTLVRDLYAYGKDVSDFVPNTLR